MSVRPPEFEGLDWGVIDQRLRAHNRRVERIALRFQLAILAVAALAASIALPVMGKNLALGLSVGVQSEGTTHVR